MQLCVDNEGFWVKSVHTIMANNMGIELPGSGENNSPPILCKMYTVLFCSTIYVDN